MAFEDLELQKYKINDSSTDTTINIDIIAPANECLKNIYIKKSDQDISNKTYTYDSNNGFKPNEDTDVAINGAMGNSAILSATDTKSATNAYYRTFSYFYCNSNINKNSVTVPKDPNEWNLGLSLTPSTTEPKITLSWTQPNLPNHYPMTVKIYRATGGNVAVTQSDTLITTVNDNWGVVQTFDDTSVVANTDYTYKIFISVTNNNSDNKTINYILFDDTDSNITYTGQWNIENVPQHYNGGLHYTLGGTSSDTIKFNFTGTSLQIGTNTYNGYGNRICTIDGVDYTFSAYGANGTLYQQIVFNKTGLENKEHSCSIHCVDNKQNTLDFIELDSGCVLKPYNANI